MTRPLDQILVIFGASGDLTKRKLMPALYELYASGMMPERFGIIGAARSCFLSETFREEQRKNIIAYSSGKLTDEHGTLLQPGIMDGFLARLHYVSFDTGNVAEYSILDQEIDRIQEEEGIPDRVIYYFATPPALSSHIPEFLKSHQMHFPRKDPRGFRRIIVEKPFGSDLESAKQLNVGLSMIFHEADIYRIDHYLGKETVQNLLVLRFANGIFEPLWNRNYVDYIEISALETLGVGTRGAYYEGAGALRDMVQNHLLLLAAYVAMEPPANFNPESIRNEVLKVFKSIHDYTSRSDLQRHVLRAQYKAGLAGEDFVPDYRMEKNVAPDSLTETFVAMRFFIDNWRWAEVPFYLTTGKAQAQAKAEIVVHFKATPFRMFKGQCSGRSCNKLTISIQPDERISLQFGIKLPGAGYEVQQESMNFYYDTLAGHRLPGAYERLLHDAMQGDATLFARGDAVEACWRFIDIIRQYWEEEPDPGLFFYPAGDTGQLRDYLTEQLDFPDSNPDASCAIC